MLFSKHIKRFDSDSGTLFPILMSDCRVSCSTAYLYRLSSLFICSALSSMCFKGTVTGFSTLLILEPSILTEKFDLLYHVVLRKIFLFLTQIHTTFTFYLIRS